MGRMRLGFTPFNAELDYEAAFPLAAELGLDLEVAYDLHEAFPLPGARELRATGEALGVGFTLHLPFVELNPASLIPSVRKLSQERLLRALEFGEALGAKVGVLHTGLIPVRHPVAERLAWEALEETLALLRDPPIPVALENLALWEQDLVRGPEELRRLLERHPHFGFCLDVGHALVELGPKGPFRYPRPWGTGFSTSTSTTTTGGGTTTSPWARGASPGRGLPPSSGVFRHGRLGGGGRPRGGAAERGAACRPPRPVTGHLSLAEGSYSGEVGSCAPFHEREAR